MKQNPSLTEEQKKVMFGGGTELPYSSDFLENKEEGTYTCANCGNELFSSKDKFVSGTGWPSFDDVSHNDAVEIKLDLSHGMTRNEILCKKCGAHLGHMFPDAPTGTSGERYCVNGTCLAFDPSSSSSRALPAGRQVDL